MIKKTKLYGPFLWVGFNCVKAAESLLGGNLGLFGCPVLKSY